MRKISLSSIVFLACASIGYSIDLGAHLPQHDLTWTEINGDFFNGAFIGDGVQGAMIIRDTIDKNDLRMLMGHYKAYAHHYISGVDNVTPRVFAGNVILSPIGNTQTRTMRMSLWNGEANGSITTDKGSVLWQAFAERKHNVIVVVVNGKDGESGVELKVREEWAISPGIYLKKKTGADYPNDVPPKPVITKEGSINLVINKLKKKGAHVVASQVIAESANKRILYVAIAADDNANIDVAAANAKKEAIARVNAAVAEGLTKITARHRQWWQSYWQNSFLEIQEDSYWQKYWWIQMYKFASASSETSDFLIDTQGPWIWNCSWAGIWWNLNLQLSYYPMYSSNQLAAGKSLINGVNRLYKSGILKKNTWGAPGITVGRSTTFDGSNGWGDEFGNIPWTLQSYWKYWKYSGNDSIAKDLFPILKESAAFLISKMEKGTDGKFHFKPSRSPEYTEDLYPDANYAIMSAKWVLQTLLELNSEFGFKDAQSTDWKDKLDNLVPYPTDNNGLRIGSTQAFDKGHRHYSHLLAIYPYHTLSPEKSSSEKDLIKRSVDHWLSYSGGYAGYSYTGGASMYATLGDGEKALQTFDKLKSHLKPNTMYSEGGGPVVETPLSGVESINYMLLQSWGGVIRVFPAVPSKWKNVKFEKFRTEGAFLVSASRTNGAMDDSLLIVSEKGKKVVLRNPWKGKQVYVVDQARKAVQTTVVDSNISFSTAIGGKYTLKNKKIETDTTVIPVSNQLQVMPEMPESNSVLVFDLRGNYQGKYEMDYDRKVVNDSKLLPGVYIIRFQNTNHAKTQKLLIR